MIKQAIFLNFRSNCKLVLKITFFGVIAALFLGQAPPAEEPQLPTLANWKRCCQLFSPRQEHAALAFQEKLWVLGGGDNEIWHTSDGITWKKAQAGPRWSGRDGHAAVVFQDKMWVLGGGNKNDVWSSPDGIEWTNETSGASSPRWSPRSQHQAVVFQDKIWILGGSDRNDVWSSANGVEWTHETEGVSSARWTGRSNHQSLAFDGKMWVLGGSRSTTHFSDVWSSSDGKDWTQITGLAGWYRRFRHASVVFNNRMWVLGGQFRGDGSLAFSVIADVWSSSNGLEWTVTRPPAWSRRRGHAAAVFNNAIWVLGGQTRDGGGNQSNRNDVYITVVR